MPHTVELLSTEKLNSHLDTLADHVLGFIPRLMLALVALFVGLWLIRILSRVVLTSLEKRDIDLTIRTFVRSLVSIGLKVLLLIMLAGMLGVQTSSFVAVIGAVGLAIGLALQGSLSNFAGGFLIVLFKPYEVGDVVEVQGHTGTVREIQIFNTILEEAHGQLIYLPNGPASNNTIVNFTRLGVRRADIEIPLPIEADVPHIRRLLLEMLSLDGRVLKSPAPEFVILGIGPGDLRTSLRFHAKRDDYWGAYHAVMEQVVELFRSQGVRFDDDAERLLIQPDAGQPA